MQKRIQKNFKQRIFFKEFEKKRLILRTICNNSFFDNSLIKKVKQKFFLFNNNSSISRIKNCCIVTGRNKKVSRFFKMTRHKFKEFSSNGFLPGVSKRSW